MRAPGNTPGAFAMEQAIDELAERLGLDPLALRDRIDPSPVRREERRLGALRFGWERRRAAGADRRTGQARPRRRPIAMGRQRPNAFVLRSAGRSRRRDRDPVGRAGHRNRRRHGDGADRRRGLRVAAARISSCASATPPFRPGPPSYGSRTTASITPPARVAAWRVLQALVARGRADPERRRRRSRRARGAHRGSRRPEPKPRLPRGRDAHERRSDQRRRLAQRRLWRVPAAHAGRGDRRPGSRRRAVRRGGGRHGDGDRARRARRRGARLRPADESAAARKPGAWRRHHGPLLRLVTKSASSIPRAGAWSTPISSNTSSPVPARRRRSKSILLENYRANSATDAYGIAEPSNIATAPAIANAVYNAIGVRLRALPMTPAAILQALGKIEKRS